MLSIKNATVLPTAVASTGIKKFCLRRNCSTTKKGKVLLIAGATASGKTDISIESAQKIGNVEIISADSGAVYKGMDIGTNKIPAAERVNIPHHLVDILPPTQSYNAALFFRDARKATQEIIERGNTPMVVGGTGFYLDWYLYPLIDQRVFIRVRYGAPGTCPAASPKLSYWRSQAVMDWEGCMKIIKQKDPEFADKLEGSNDTYRMARALDVMEVTNRPFSSYLVHKEEREALPHESRGFYLHLPRQILYDIADFRCEKMIQRGLLQEISKLYRNGQLQPDTPASRAVGYRQGLDFLLGSRTVDKFWQFLELYQTRTRHIIHNQSHWFRKTGRVYWLSNTDILKILRPNDVSQGTPAVTDQLLKLYHTTEQEFLQALETDQQKKLRALEEEEMEALRTRKPKRYIYHSAAVVSQLLKELTKY